MEIIVSSRNDDIKKGVKKHAEQRAIALQSMYQYLTSCRVVLNIEKNEETAEVILHGKNIDFETVVSTRDLYESIDKAMNKIEVQLQKHLDKLHNHH
ncbi:MAG: ribosome hibernation-promoting factor, HPF/YfiA family [Lentisphaeria bacterium]